MLLVLIELLLATTNSSAAACRRLIGGSGGTAVKSAALVAAPLVLAVLACCGHRLLPRQLAVLPDGMVPVIICPGIRVIRTYFGVELCSVLVSTCVVHRVVINHLFFVSAPPSMPLCDKA